MPVVETYQYEPIVLTDKALNHVVGYLKKTENLGIRVSVKKTGCSGYSYQVDYVKESSSKDLVFPLHEHYFLYMDKESYPYLKGVHMDYVTTGFQSKLIFENPNQKGQCGCGESFTV
ncbi:MAG: iron-sulfur cluster assembly accessory protein [Legionellaceae bacterium]|nr:iron-sulfur cluster assembly accessory protein [Legionellaceae bacterium]